MNNLEDISVKPFSFIHSFIHSLNNHGFITLPLWCTLALNAHNDSGCVSNCVSKHMIDILYAVVFSIISIVLLGVGIEPATFRIKRS
jgi:hypothetical protein